MVVVLPAPLGPSRPTISPFGHVEVDAVDGHERAEALAQLVDADGEGPGGGHASASGVGLERLGQVAQGADGGPDAAAVVGVEAGQRVAQHVGPFPAPPLDAGPAGSGGAAARRPGGRPDRRCAR